MRESFDVKLKKKKEREEKEKEEEKKKKLTKIRYGPRHSSSG
jgi:hypothetical protein